MYVKIRHFNSNLLFVNKAGAPPEGKAPAKGLDNGLGCECIYHFDRHFSL